MKTPIDLQNKAIILGIKIDDQPIDYFLDKTKEFMHSDRAHIIFTPNPEIVLKSTQIKGYKETLNSADLNLPDGFGLKLGAKILGIELRNRVTGADFTKKIIEANNTASIFVVLRKDSLTKDEDLKAFFSARYPQVKIDCAYSPKTSDAEQALINQINNHKTQILFLCLGAPEQEFWIKENMKRLADIKIALAVGGSFDFLTNKIPRAPELLRQIGMEWLYRLYQEPKRLIRIKHATADFLLECHRWAKRIKTQFRPNVLGVIQNEKGEFLIQKNIQLGNHWQFPQGGVDDKETEEEAILREINEELNLDISHLKIVKKLKADNTYIPPKHHQLLHGYKGQKQVAFLIKYSGNINETNFTSTREVATIKWQNKFEILKLIHPARRQFAQNLLNEI